MGHRPVPRGPQKPAVYQVLHPQKRWERWHPRSIVLHSRAAEQLMRGLSLSQRTHHSVDGKSCSCLPALRAVSAACDTSPSANAELFDPSRMSNWPFRGLGIFWHQLCAGSRTLAAGRGTQIPSVSQTVSLRGLLSDLLVS